MTIEIIRCLADNYAYLIHDAASGETTLIDAPEAAPILATLKGKGWTLTRILITHHHNDHIDGVADILAQAPAEVYGAAADALRLPPLDHAFAPGDTLPGGAQVMDAPGHTVGHVAFYYPALKALFTADSLMTHGCGRLFEGTPDQMFDTIAAFAALPDDTRIYSGHDYARANLTFAAQYAPEPSALAARQVALQQLADKGLPTTGTTLESEKQLNPYLRCHLPAVAQAAGVPGADPRRVLAEIRRQKNNA
ncbi:hydroxyacylglutathione hydrolase [Pararhodobacter zhoushanensis]|uniref:hydroxyacylglutathione hydrolase n=1 Tax=Pararhodobacter zhoushanensis TaxID=2479545 RepID=UPI000F8DDDCA|nr:hydroxyacylglutathione hydrolase [Pararhodobacter zhoushanensis]